MAQRQQDDAAHTMILDKLRTYETEMRVSNARNEEKDKAETKLRRQIAALALFFVTTATGLVSWGVMEARDLHQGINDNTAHFKEFQAIGIEWGDAIDDRAEHFHDDLKELRQRLNSHQQRHRNGEKD